MARNAATAGTAIASLVAALGITAGVPVTSGQLQAFWTAVANGFFIHDAANAVVLPGSFTTGGGPVTGAGGPIG